MNKFKKNVALFVALFISLFTLVSCSNYDFYSDWSKAGASIEKDNVFLSLSADEVKTKRDNGETFVILVGSSTDSKAVSAITAIQEQADIVGYTGNVYFVNAKDVSSSSASSASRNEFKEKVGLKAFTSVSTEANLVVVAYKKGVVELDTSSTTKCDYTFFNNDNSQDLNFEYVAHYLFEFDTYYNN